MHPRVSTLPNGCQLSVVQVPDASCAALAIEISAGSLDEPDEWPGLAHFLEHLLFLGGERFVEADRLMPFIQGCGGRVNATTGPTSTQYYFEAPVAQFAGAAERLFDMLARPRLSVDDQLREREVIEAEYQARAADAGQLAQSALLALMAPEHPLCAFHAGNRASLSVEDGRFQQALRRFHQRFYGTRHCRVVIAGPQSAEMLEQLACRLIDELPKGGEARTLEAPLPQPAAAHATLQLPVATPRLWLGIRLAGGVVTHAALDALEAALASGLPASLQDRLAEAGWASGLRVHRLYRGAHHAILGVEAELVDTNHAPRVQGAVADWLRFWKARLDASTEVARVARPFAGLAPLELVRQGLAFDDAPWSESLVGGGSAQLAALLEQTCQPIPSVLVCEDVPGAPTVVCGFPARLSAAVMPQADVRLIFERLPCNPLLEVAPLAATKLRPAGLHCFPHAGPQAALRLRAWRGVDGVRSGAVAPALRSLTAAAEQLGMTLVVEDTREGYLLRCDGPGEQLPDLLWQIGQALQRGGEGPSLPSPAEMPLRRLLRELPDALDALLSARLKPAPGWEAVLVGMTPAQLARLNTAFSAFPGEPGRRPVAPWPRIGNETRIVPCAGDDAAVLLFCPVATASAEHEAAWRMLGQLLQPAFYRRMREELQLGYGVFCGFQQHRGRAGLMLALQSPSASCEELKRHVQAFLVAQRQQLAAIDPALLREQAKGLGRRLDDLGSRPGGLADQLWQAHLAGQPPSHPRQVCQALEGVSIACLQTALEAITAGETGRLSLQNQP